MKKEVAEKVAIDTVINIISIYCPRVGAGLELLKDIADGDYGEAIDNGSDIEDLDLLLGNHPTVLNGSKSFAKVLSAVFE